MSFLVHFLFLCSLASAASLISRSPDRTVNLAKRASCTPASAGSASTDDVPAIQSAITSCGKGGVIVIPAGKTYMIRSPLSFGECSTCDFQIEGTLKVSDDLDYWEGKSNIIVMSGVSGAKVHSVTGTGVIDGNGQAAYDRFAQDSTYARPTLYSVQGGSTNIHIYNLKVKNPPNVFFSVNGASSNVAFSDLTMTASSKSTYAPKNTDGFDIGSSAYVTLYNISVQNQDDCVAFKPGCNYCTIDTITCDGSHGLSVGSLGSKAGATDTVKNVYVKNAMMKNSAKAVGIKLYPGGPDHGTAVVSNVTYDGVTVENSDYAIQIQSCYNEDADYCAEYPSTATIADVYFKGFAGETSAKYDPVVADLDCSAKGTCGIDVSGFKVTAPSGKANVLCSNVDNGAGITCAGAASG